MSRIRDFELPDLGEGLEEGEIVEWRVTVGDVVELNQIVVEVETAKAVVEVPSPFAGRVVDRLGEVGDTLAVGAVILRIEVAVEAQDTVATQDTVGTEEDGPSHPSTGLDAEHEPQPLVGYGQQAATSGSRRRRGHAAPDETGGAAPAALASPPVRKLAKDLGIELSALAPGSGPDGVVTREDVRSAAAAMGPSTTPASASAPTDGTPGPTERPSASPGRGFRGREPGDVEPLRGVRRRIAETVARSRREIPEATCSRDADLTELWELRTSLTEAAHADGLDVRITPLVLIMRAVLVGLRRFPTLNARLVDTPPSGSVASPRQEIHLLDHVNLGFAADTQRGLLVPNIKAAHTKSTVELASELKRLADGARTGALDPTELTGGTFTVDNYGAFGNDDGDPIINHPEAAILGIGAIRLRPWVLTTSEDGDAAPMDVHRITARRVARFTLAFDHRICDGGEAGRFVTYVADLCERPTRLLLHL